jgi:carbonic anhydrase
MGDTVSPSRGCTACGCGDFVVRRFERRRFLLFAAAGSLAAGLPSLAAAASGEYEAMALTCIDPRFQAPVFHYLSRRGLTGKYSQFTIAGAAAGVVAPTFTDWHKAFWDNLAASVQLHRIKKVIVIDHRDCGPVRIAYGEASIANKHSETRTHRAILAEFRKQLAERQPALIPETGLMDLDGTVLPL